MGNLIEQLQGRKAFLKLSWEDVAKRVSKDVSTCKKQLAPSANPTISVLEEYAKAFDSEIALLSDDAKSDLATSGVPRAQKSMAELDREVERLKEKLDEKDAVISDYRARIKETTEMLAKSIDDIHHKDEIIEKLTNKLLGV